MTNQSDDDLLTLTAAARWLDIAPATVIGWANRGRLPIASWEYHYSHWTRFVRRGDVVACSIAMWRSKSRNKGPRKPELTAEELDKMVAERMKPENLPKWWFKEMPEEPAQREAGVSVLERKLMEARRVMRC